MFVFIHLKATIYIYRKSGLSNKIVRKGARVGGGRPILTNGVEDFVEVEVCRQRRKQQWMWTVKKLAVFPAQILNIQSSKSVK